MCLKSLITNWRRENFGNQHLTNLQSRMCQQHLFDSCWLITDVLSHPIFPVVDCGVQNECSLVVVRTGVSGIVIETCLVYCIDTQHSECAPAVQGEPGGAQRPVRHASTSAFYVPLGEFDCRLLLHSHAAPYTDRM